MLSHYFADKIQSKLCRLASAFDYVNAITSNPVVCVIPPLKLFSCKNLGLICVHLLTGSRKGLLVNCDINYRFVQLAFPISSTH